MNWEEALEIVVRRTKHERYRVLCDEGNPDIEQRDEMRAMMIRKALNEPDPPPFIPPEMTEAELKALLGCCGGGLLP